MADIYIPSQQPSFSEAYTAANNGDSLIFQDSGPYALVPVILKKIDVKSESNTVLTPSAPTAAYGLRVQAAGTDSSFTGVVIKSGKTAAVSAEKSKFLLKGCTIEEDTVNNSALYAVFVNDGGDVTIENGTVNSLAYAARVVDGGKLSVRGAYLTSTLAKSSIAILWLDPKGKGASLFVESCTIDAKDCVGCIKQLSSVASGSSFFVVNNNNITHSSSTGHTIHVGSEETVFGADYKIAYTISGNVINGFKSTAGVDGQGIAHNIFIGFNVNGSVHNNTIMNGGMALVWKGNGSGNTTGFFCRNVVSGCNVGIRIKGVDGAIIANNTVHTKGASSESAIHITDKDGANSSNNIQLIGNVFYAEDYDRVLRIGANVSFAKIMRNAYFCNTLNSFEFGGRTKSWAEWVAFSNEQNSFCFVKSGNSWDVYTSGNPTVKHTTVGKTVDFSTGRLVDISTNFLVGKSVVVPNVNEVGALDIWGNVVADAPNIGADQNKLPSTPSVPTGDFSAWVPFTGGMSSLAFASSAPGKLREVQVWSKLIEL